MVEVLITFESQFGIQKPVPHSSSNSYGVHYEFQL